MKADAILSVFSVYCSAVMNVFYLAMKIIFSDRRRKRLLSVFILLLICLCSCKPKSSNNRAANDGELRSIAPQSTGARNAGQFSTEPQNTGQFSSEPQSAGQLSTGPQGSGPQSSGPQNTGQFSTESNEGQLSIGPQSSGSSSTGPQDTGQMSTGPQGPGTQSTGLQAPEQQSSGPQTEGNALTLERTGKQDESSQNEKEEGRKSSDKDSTEFTGPVELQKQFSHSYILPESFLIGPLSDSLSSRPAERDIVYAADIFWDKFRSGGVLNSYLASYPHPLFLEELEEYSGIAGDIRAVETGRLHTDGNSSRMNCLVHSGSGCLEGTLYFIREEGIWFVEDWEIPFRNWPGKEPGREEDKIAPPVTW